MDRREPILQNFMARNDSYKSTNHSFSVSFRGKILKHVLSFSCKPPFGFCEIYVNNANEKLGAVALYSPVK